MQTHLYMIITVVSGSLNRLPYNGFHVRMRCRMQFSGNKNFARRRQYFAGDAGIRIFFETGIQNACLLYTSNILNGLRKSTIAVQNFRNCHFYFENSYMSS